MEQASEVPAGQGSVKLKNTVWVRPITIEDEPVHVNIRLIPETANDVQFDIYSGRKQISRPFTAKGQYQSALTPRLRSLISKAEITIRRDTVFCR